MKKIIIHYAIDNKAIGRPIACVNSVTCKNRELLILDEADDTGLRDIDGTAEEVKLNIRKILGYTEEEVFFEFHPPIVDEKIHFIALRTQRISKVGYAKGIFL